MGFLALLRQQRLGEPLEDVGLLIAIEAARDAAPEDPPLDLGFDAVREPQAGGVDAARLLDAEIVAGIAEAGPQAEAAQIQPAASSAAPRPRPSANSSIQSASWRIVGKRPRVAARAPASARACSAVLPAAAIGPGRMWPRSTRERSLIAVSLITAAGRRRLLSLRRFAQARTAAASDVR